MGPAGRLGLCLVLSAVSHADNWTLTRCPDCPMAFCLNESHCGCPPGYRPPPWPRKPTVLESCDDINECLEQPPRCGPHQSCNNTQGGFNCYCSPGYQRAPPVGHPPTGPPPLDCVDVDECAGGQAGCGGGSVCFNTPGSFECHCAPGYADTPTHGCAAVMVPPDICTGEEVGCELERTLTRLYELLRGGGNPHHILQELLAVLDLALEVGDEDATRRHRRVTALLAATEGLVRGVGALLPPPAVTTVTSNRTELRLAVHQGPPPGPVRLQVPKVGLDVPREVARDRDTGPALVALLSQGGLGRALEGAPKVQWGGWGDLPPPPAGAVPSYRLLSPVATAFVTRPRPPGPPEVTLRFEHGLPHPELQGRVLCAFWDPQERLWATAGCREVTPPPPGAPPGTTCACNHLTSFAVLMAFYELEDSWVLDVVTKVGLGVSVAALGVAVATFLLCRALKGLRTTLHLHLSLSLLLAHGTFLLGIERTQHPTVCAVVAGLLHFFFLAVFCWMCLEGLHLYVLLVRVFMPSWLRVRHLLLVGYGLPALLVTIAAASFPGGYGTDRYCWLSLDRGFRWSFQAPVCLVIALNAVILVVTVWKLVQKFNDVNPDMGHLRKLRVLVTTGVGQLCLLGTGWALGLGLGGGLLILLCHCLAHPQVREAYRACFCPGSKRYSEFTSNTSNTSNTRLSRQHTYT
ncbi:adhesion G protein-coupled receptor E5-like [Grus japonensis]|uniref:Adhesion G protein-coupled receptor E5-like n=1 Tax=Grus japonensis TaxID=30415 RepID=A0ABC9XYZ0_GRUJA